MGGKSNKNVQSREPVAKSYICTIVSVRVRVRVGVSVRVRGWLILKPAPCRSGPAML